MCVAAAPARFSATILYCGAVDHPRHGHIHVLGYQNTPQNLAAGPNAMLLHLPAVEMKREQFLDTSSCRSVLRDMVAAVDDPPRPGRSMVLADAMPGVDVFEHDIYTVILADDATLIPAAMSMVEARKRIAPDPELCAFYARWFSGYPIALCCFDNRDAAKAAPLLFWYRPRHPDELAMPAIDSHTGGAPDLDADVAVDHWVITAGAGPDSGAAVHYRDEIPSGLREFLPSHVLGSRLHGTLPNGDFVISATAATPAGAAVMRRTPGAAPREREVAQAAWPGMLVTEAMKLAREAHAGQLDKSGRPYIEHVERVVGLVSDPVAQAVAALHDTVEDTDVTLEELARRGFSSEVVAAVDALTRRADETYYEFVLRAVRNPIAHAVKVADLMDNSDERRLALLDPREAERLRRRYRCALTLLRGREDSHGPAIRWLSPNSP